MPDDKLYLVRVVIVGECEVPVSAATPDEAVEKAADCVSPLHAKSWEYCPEDAISLDHDVREVVVDSDEFSLVTGA